MKNNFVASIFYLLLHPYELTNMQRLTTIKEKFFSVPMRFTILESNFTINDQTVIAYLRTYDGQELDLSRFYLDINDIPFPFSFKVSKPNSLLDVLREMNGLEVLRSVLYSEKQDIALAQRFINEAKTFFLTFNN